MLKNVGESMPVPPSSFQGEVYNTKEQLLSPEESIQDEVLKQVFEWALAECAKEKERLKGSGVDPIDLPIVDMSVLVQGAKKQLNRVVFDS